MSWSINIDGGKKADMRNAIRLHIIRQSENEGKDAVAHLKSGSHIEPERTTMNVLLIDEPERFSKMRQKLKIMDGKRAEEGKRAMRSNCEVFGRGTIQLSDDTLELLGWKFKENEKGDPEKLPASQQDERTIKNVTVVYKRLFDSARKQPEIYGEIFTGCIHFDEDSPHLDFLTDPLDVETGQTLRNLKAGKQKLSNMQDVLGKYAGFSDQEIQNFDLRRGTPKNKKTDLAQSARSAKRAEKKAREELEKMTEERDRLIEEREKLEKWAKELKKAKKGLEIKNEQVKAKEEQVKRFAELVEEEKIKLDKREEKITKREKALKATQQSQESQEQILRDLAEENHAKEQNLLKIHSTTLEALEKLAQKGMRLTESQRKEMNRAFREMHHKLEEHKTETEPNKVLDDEDMKFFNDTLEELKRIQDGQGMSL